MAYSKETVQNLNYTGSTSFLGGGSVQHFVDPQGRNQSVEIPQGADRYQAVADYLNKLESGQVQSAPITPGTVVDPRSVAPSTSGYNYKSPAISSLNQAPQTPIPYQSPAPVQQFPTLNLMTPEELAGGTSGVADWMKRTGQTTGQAAPTAPALSAPETEMSRRIKDIQAKQLEAAGRPAYQAQQEDIQGVQAKQQLINDLTNQLNLIKVEGQSIPLQAAGVNVTAGMLGAQQAEQGRQNAVKALTVYAQLQGAQGNLQTAQAAADRATDLKYAPIEAEIKAGLANIALMKQDPELTLAEEKRLDEREAIKKKQQAGIDLEKSTTTTVRTAIMNILNDPDFQIQAPLSVKTKLGELASRTLLTPVENVLAANLGARYRAAAKAPTKPTSEEQKKIDYKTADKFLTDNPKATYDDLKNTLLEKTVLNSTEVDAYLASKGITNKLDVISKMKSSFQQAKDLGFTRQQVVDKFKQDNGIDMPPNLVSELDKIYPEAQTKPWWHFW